MVEINLLENQIIDRTDAPFKQQKALFFVAIFVLVVLVIAIIAAVLITHKTENKISEIKKDTQDSTLDISDQRSKLKEAEAYQAKLSNINWLLQNHTYMSSLFDELENYTFVRGKYDVFQASQDASKIELQGTTDSYENLGKLILGLSASPNFTDVSLVSVHKDSGKIGLYQFSVGMKVKANIFSKE